MSAPAQLPMLFRRRASLAPLLVALAPFALFVGALGYGFLPGWDDGVYVVLNRNMALSADNLRLCFSQTLNNLYTPLAQLSLMADYALFGLDAALLRLHNIVLHCVAACFLYGIGRRLGLRAWLSCAAALLWSCNPQKVESVVWITERKDVLSGALAFAAVFFFLGALKKGRVPVTAALLGAAAVLAKPSATPLFGVFAVLAVAELGRVPREKYLRALALPCGVSLAAALFSLVMTVRAGGAAVPQSSWRLPVYSFFYYPLTALFPFDVNPVHPLLLHWSDCAWAVAGGAGLFVAGVFAARRLGFGARGIVCALLIVAGSMVPVLGLRHFSELSVCDRFNYAVSAAVCLCLALAAERAMARDPRRERRILAGTAVWLCVFVLLTLHYLPVWKSEKTLAFAVLQNPRPLPEVLFECASTTALAECDAELMEALGLRQITEADAHGEKALFLRWRGEMYLLRAALLRGDRAEIRRRYGELSAPGLDYPVPGNYYRTVFLSDMALAAYSLGADDAATQYAKATLAQRKYDDLGVHKALTLLGLLESRGDFLARGVAGVAELAPERFRRTPYEALKKRLDAGESADGLGRIDFLPEAR